jgi:excisionase family DNA binding protein
VLKALPYFDAAVPALRLLDINEAAELMGVSVVVLREEIAAGRLSACRIKNRWKLTHAHLEAWVKRIETLALDS